MHTEVLIVGAGPVGCALALELAHHGVASVVIEKSRETTRHPKMDYLNVRSMELLRRLGLTEELRAKGVPSDQAFSFHWTTGLAGPGVASWSYWSVDDLRAHMAAANDGSLPCEPYQRVIGSRVEDLGRRRCRESALVDLREGWTFESLSQDADGVTVEVADVHSGRTERLRARYAVGCDGSGSAVRTAAGITVGTIGPAGQHRRPLTRTRGS